MITTGCNGCCFFKQDDKSREWGCGIHQLCVTEKDRTFAPGYCRYCRSYKWAKKQDEPGGRPLLRTAIIENALKFDLLVFFDESRDSLDSLNRTFSTDWYCSYVKKIIIVDVTGFGQRENLALQYLKDQKLNIPVTVDSSVAHESISERESTIKRLSKQITSPFFMTIPAGRVFLNMDLLAKNVQNVPSRVIQWTFPWTMGGTMVIPNRYYYGLFITKPYRALTGSPGAKPFSEQLRVEEEETKMGLSWFCQECGLI